MAGTSPACSRTGGGVVKRGAGLKRTARLTARRPEPGSVRTATRSPLLPCGKGWATEAEAKASPRGQQDGAVIFACWLSSCPKWHVRSPPVPVKAVPAQRPGRETGFPAAVKLAVRKRAGPGEMDEARCEACGKHLGRYGGEIQHRLARGAGGSRSTIVNGISNAALLCREEHALAESRDEGMRLAGWWIRSGNGPGHDPRFVPVTLMSATGEPVTAWLAEDGTYSSAPPKALAS